jgi:hypothetical protein
MTATLHERAASTTLKGSYIWLAIGLWICFLFLLACVALGVLVAIQAREPGYLLLSAGSGFLAWLFGYAGQDHAAVITMDEKGFTAITLGLRRKGWEWADTRAEASPNWKGWAGGPVVSLRHRSKEREKVYLRKADSWYRGYDDAMRFAVEHAAQQVPFEEAVSERRQRSRR